MSRLLSYVRRNAWPIGIVSVIAAFLAGDAIMVTMATRDPTFGVEENYYQRAVQYDQQRSADLRTTTAGWTVRIEIADVPFPDMPRRVDVRITDSAGRPVDGVAGRLTAIRPADVRLRNGGDLIAVPDQSGLYRLLLKVPVQGLWEFDLAAVKSGEPYHAVVRQDVRFGSAEGGT
jgi:nitrogen fixation protein FixH